MSYTISEQVKLPSGGTIYDKQFDPNVTLRSMTTEDEMKRLSPCELPYKMMSEVIDDCINETIPISSYDMCIGDYEYLLHKLRIVTFGADYGLRTTCPVCRTEDESVIDLDSFEVLTLEDAENNFTFTLPKSGDEIKINFQTPHMMDMVLQKQREAKKKMKTATDASMLYLLSALIRTVNGKTLDEFHKELYVRKMPLADSNFIIKKADKFNRKVGINTTTKHICSNCGVEYDVPFRFNETYFGPSVDE